MKELILSLLCGLVAARPAASHIFVAYIPSWITGYASPCNLNLATLNVAHFTHLNVPFAYFDTVNFVLTPQNGDDTNGWYKSVQSLKSKNSELKVLISVGGGGFGGNPWQVMVSSAANRAKFIANAINFARAHNFDGIDIDWEVPEAGQTALINELFSSFHANIVNVDWINVMNYDYYGPWSSVIGANTAFAGSAGLDITSTFSYFSGVPASKLVMGFANYARTFKLSSTSRTTPGSPFSGAGAAGPCTSSAGTYSYYEVANYLASHPTGTEVYDSISKTPYFYDGTQWVTFDNIASLQVKLAYINSQGYKGAMVWALDGNSTITDAIASGLTMQR